MIKKYIIFLLTAFLFSGEFNLSNLESASTSQVIFNIGEISFESKGQHTSVLSDSRGKTQNYGEPELPTYTMNYSISRNKEYSVSYNVTDFEIHENIELYPSQPIFANNKDKQGLIKNYEIYNSELIYPESKLNVVRNSFRGYQFLSIELIPYEYNFKTKQLKILKTVEVIIEESGTRLNENDIPRSMVFENIFKNMIINDESFTDSRSIQQPSVLYIMEDYSSSIEPLIEWRRKQGFNVIVVDRDQTGSSTTSIKNYITSAYNNWANPPEFVCLVGDANGTMEVATYSVGEGGSWWGAYGEGDFPYTLIDGNDNFPDIIIGRMSVRSTSSLVTVVNKIIGYEKNYAGSTNWLRAAALVGDPYDSGISTVITNEFIEETIEIHGGITDLRTKYSGSGFDTFMRDQINDGISYLNYRGFYGFSNFNISDIGQLNNGYKLPFLTTLTCDTGSFSTDNECITEALFRAGSATSPKGAVAVVGTAQPYTHTAFNNIVTMGMYDGIFLSGAKTAGEALIYGQLALAEIYPQNPNNNVYYFSTWNNLMGDPTTQLWTSVPTELTVEHNEILIEGSNNFQVYVSDLFGQAYQNAYVTLYKPDNNSDGIQMSSHTNELGIADFEIDSSIDGEVFVTTRCHNCAPVESEFEIIDDLPEVVLNVESIIIDDTIGNNDAHFNPDETIGVSFEINNLSIQQIENLSLSLTSFSEYITIESSEVTIGTLSPAGTFFVEGLLISSSSDMPDNQNPELRILLSNNMGDLFWNYILPIDFISADLEFTSYITNDNNNNGILERGENGRLHVSALNAGSMPLVDLNAEIDYNGAILNFNTNEFNFSDVNINQTQTANYVQVDVNQLAIHGAVVSIPLILTSDNGFSSYEVIQLQIGALTENDPTGPDSYGYYIYDMNDDDYQLAPDYQWIEIDPSYGGSGAEIGINDSGDNNDDVETVNLPFPFTFYGIEYDEISICSNGWVSFGQTDMRSFRNYTLPGPGGPSPMVAVFWDDLKTTSGGDVLTYYDSQEDIYIIEWSDVRTFFNNTVESFQLILYDTGWQTPTGDDEMKMQYKEFNNNSTGDYPVGNYDGAVVHGQYCTVGLENHSANDGLQYTYNNSYHESAMTLSDETALFITTRSEFDFAQPSITYDASSYYFELNSEEEETATLTLSNDGEEGSMLLFSAGVSPFSSGLDKLDDFGYAWTESNSDNDVDYNWIDIDDDYSTLIFNSNDGGAGLGFGFNFPFYGSEYGLCAVMENGWIAFDVAEEEWNNGSVFDGSSPKGAIFSFWDDLNPINNSGGGSGQVKYHSNSDRVVIWYDHVTHYNNPSQIYDFQIILHSTGKIDVNYREMIGDTGSATVGIIDPDGNYGLEVIYNQDNFIENETSVVFDTSPTWINIEFADNQIFQNETEQISINVEADETMGGIYSSYILIESNSNVDDALSIPVMLTVSVLNGDVNQDDVVDVLDVVRVISIIFGDYNPTNLEYFLSDVNADGIVNVQDIIVIVNIILSQ